MVLENGKVVNWAKHNGPFYRIFFDGLECAGNSFAYVAHFVFLRYDEFEPRKQRKL